MRHSATRSGQAPTAHGSVRTRIAATLSALAVAGGVTAALLGAFGGTTTSVASPPAAHASGMHGDGTQMG